MLKLILTAGLLAALYLSNPTMEDAAVEAKRRVTEEQSGMRAGWSSVSKITGINWLSKQAGAGNYEFCRSDLYLASFYLIRNAKLLDSEKPVAVMFGAGGKVWGWRIAPKGETQSMFVDQLETITNQLSFSDCRKFHNSGELGIG